MRLKPLFSDAASFQKTAGGEKRHKGSSVYIHYLAWHSLRSMNLHNEEQSDNLQKLTGHSPRVEGSQLQSP